MAQETPSNASRTAKYRGAAIQDLDPPPALSITPQTPISHALLTAFERDYTHLTVVSPSKSLLGYLSIPHLKTLLEQKKVTDQDAIETAMLKFDRRKKEGRRYKVITMDTGLDDLEGFFEGEVTGQKEDFAVITDEERRFVLGVATRGDLEEFVKRRGGL